MNAKNPKQKECMVVAGQKTSPSQGRHLSQLFHGVVEGGIELGHGGFGFVAHVRDAERRAFDLSVTTVDEEALVFDELLKFGHIRDASAGLRPIVDAGEGDGFKAFFWKQSETMTRG